MGTEKSDSSKCPVGYKLVAIITIVLIIMIVLMVGSILFAVKLANQQSQLKDDLKSAKEELRSLGFQFDLLVEGIAAVKRYPAANVNRLRRSATGDSQKVDPVSTMHKLLEYFMLHRQGQARSNVACKCRDGKSGPRGKSGPKGEKGENGRHGTQGPTGPQGLRGENGSKGQKGETGQRGYPGLSVEEPRLITTPRNTTVLQGSVATFTCKVTGYPDPILKWFHKNVFIKNGKKFMVLPGGGGLQINNVRSNDRGEVKCVASNVIGAVESHALLIVHVPPNVEIANRQLMVYEGQNFELRCNAAGIPRPRITWQRVRGRMPSSVKKLSSGVISFSGAKISDSGFYQCAAKNSAGDASETVMLYVRAVYKSCKETLGKRPELDDGFYRLNSGNHYCFMSDIPGCGGGGWTLAMKLDGKKNTFESSSVHWTKNTLYKSSGILRSLDDVLEAKFAAFNVLRLNEICVGMEQSGKRRWIRLPVASSSLLDLFKSERYSATRVGRNAWKGLIQGSSLQPYCNREGINVRSNKGSFYNLYCRIGIIGNEQNECFSPDSYIGFGTLKSSICGKTTTMSCGNFASCGADNGDKLLATTGYILIK